jgi:hypothetical protein
VPRQSEGGLTLRTSVIGSKGGPADRPWIAVEWISSP